MTRRAWILSICLPAGVAVAGLWVWDRYNFAVLWPAKVQLEVAGAELAGYESQASRERSFAYGQGFARWRYRVDGSRAAVRRLCGNRGAERCNFSRTLHIEEGVDISVGISNGILTVEEWWR